MGINILSLFDGHSTGRLVCQKAGIEVDKYFASEIDENAIQISKNNFEDIIRLGDITKINKDMIIKLPKIDLLIGGSPCFIAGTLILTDKGYKNIEDIQEGDKVLTHTNTYQKVVKPMINGANSIYRLKTMCSEDLLVTEEHPFYVRKRSRIYNNNMPNLKHGIGYERKFSEPEWIKVKYLSKDYYVGIAINQKSELPKWGGIESNIGLGKVVKNEMSGKFNNPNFWWIIGRYIGDGWTNLHKRKNRKNSYLYKTIICCNKDKIKNELKDITDRLDNMFHYTVTEERTTYKICVSSEELYAYLQQFGKYAYGKHLTSDIINLPVNLLQSFMEGYFSADGNVRKDGKSKIASVSKELIYGTAQCVAKAYKTPYSIYKINRPKKYKIEDRIINQRDVYEIYFKKDVKKQDKAFYENGYIWCPINGLEKEGYNGLVYNMEVENDNSYTANGIIVHNCQGFSRNGACLNFEDPRSKLFFDYVRILNLIREYNNPDVQFLLENVEMKKEWRNVISDYLKAEYTLINSKLVSSQNRPRLYWTSTYIEPPKDKQIKLLDILENVDTSNYINYKGLLIDPNISEKAYSLIDVVDGEVRISQATKQGYIVAENGDGVNLQFPTSKTRRGRVIKDKSNTLDCSCDICVYYDGIIRKFTITELERLQTLPDGYTKGLSDKARIKAIGNGWTTDVIVEILKQYKFN